MKSFAAITLTLAAAFHGAAACAQSNSPGTAAAIGATVAGIVECGEGYSSHELYNVKVSVQEILRGPPASERLSAASEIPAPAADSEYLLARVSFNFKARGKPGLCAHPLRPTQFKAISAAGAEYPRPDFPPPDPALTGEIKSGETLIGWLVYIVPRIDSTPLLYFNVDENGGVSHGGNLWFKLGAE